MKSLRMLMSTAMLMGVSAVTATEGQAFDIGGFLKSAAGLDVGISTATSAQAAAAVKKDPLKAVAAAAECRNDSLTCAKKGRTVYCAAIVADKNAVKKISNNPDSLEEFCSMEDEAGKDISACGDMPTILKKFEKAGGKLPQAEEEEAEEAPDEDDSEEAAPPPPAKKPAASKTKSK